MDKPIKYVKKHGIDTTDLKKPSCKYCKSQFTNHVDRFANHFRLGKCAPFQTQIGLNNTTALTILEKSIAHYRSSSKYKNSQTFKKS